MDKILHRIENFDEYFDGAYIYPPYARAWELNRKHSIRLNQLPHESVAYIVNLIQVNKPTTILEIGTSAAYTSIQMASAALQYGGHVYTIEKSAPKAEIARVNISESGLHNITLLEGEALDIVMHWTREIDLLLIDADRKRYLEFFKLAEPHLSPAAIVIADNVSNFKHEVENFLNYFVDNLDYRSEIVPMPNGLFFAYKKDINNR